MTVTLAITDYLSAFEARSSALNHYINLLRAAASKNTSPTNGREELKQSIRAYAAYVEKEERTVLTPLERALSLVRSPLRLPRDVSLT